jgi:hypothetical protein
MLDDARTVREAIDLLSVLGEPLVAKRAEEAISRITGTDHESQPIVSTDWTPFMTVRRSELERIEALLGEAMNATGTSSLTYKKAAEAAAEIRSMIGGQE